MYQKHTKRDFKTQGRTRNPRQKTYETAEPALTVAAESSLSELNVADSRILKRSSLSPENRLTGFQKISMIDKGISKQDLFNFKERAGWDYNQLSDILGVARAKLISKKSEERFDKQVSERIVGLADLYSYGYEVFEDESRFNSWIFTSNHSLGGLAPFDYLDTQFGREEVKDLIGRIDYGVYS